MNKKAIICSLCLSLAFSLVGCGGQAPEPQEPQNIQQTKEVTPPATSIQAETKPIEKKQEDKTVAPPIEESQAMESEAGTDGADGEDESPEGNVAEVELFTEVNETVYVTNTDSVNIRPHWSTDNEKIGSLSRGASIKRIGVGIAGSEADSWSKVELSDGTVAFISSNYLSTSKPSAGKSSGGKVTTPASKPASSSSDGSSGNAGSSAVGSDGLTEQERREIEIARARNPFGKDTQLSPEEVANSTTDGDTMIYH